jgi:hypothetical protein
MMRKAPCQALPPTNWPQVRQPEGALEHLQDIAPCRAVRQGHREAHAPRHHHNLPRGHLQQAVLRGQQQRTCSAAVSQACSGAAVVAVLVDLSSSAGCLVALADVACGVWRVATHVFQARQGCWHVKHRCWRYAAQRAAARSCTCTCRSHSHTTLHTHRHAANQCGCRQQHHC